MTTRLSHAPDLTVVLYRLTNLITGALFLIAGAVVLSVMLIVPFFLLFALAMVTMWLVWLPAISTRVAVADFVERDLAGKFSPDGSKGRGLTVEAYSKLFSFRLRRRVAQVAGPSTTFSRRLDIWLPLIITVTWLLLFSFHVTALSAMLVGA